MIERVEAHLRYAHSPRMHMAAIVLVTGLAGFWFSYALLQAGLDAMWLRYPIAVALAYGVFLALLRIWLTCQLALFNREHRDRGFDLSDIPVDLLFDGGGGAGGGGEAASATDVFDLDDAVFLVVAIAALLGAVLAVFYIVYAAPALFAEVFVDGVLVTGLYRCLRKENPRHWMYGALRRTCVPALITALLFGLAGFAMQQFDPGAKSIGHVCQRLMRY